MFVEGAQLAELGVVMGVVCLLKAPGWQSWGLSWGDVFVEGAQLAELGVVMRVMCLLKAPSWQSWGLSWGWCVC